MAGRGLYLLVVGLLAVAATALSFAFIPLSGNWLFPFTALLCYAVAYTELTRPGSSSVDLNSAWLFAAAALLHPGLAGIVIAGSSLYRSVRIGQRHVVRTAAVAVVAGYAASGTLLAVGGWVVDGRGSVVLMLAGLAFLLVKVGLVVTRPIRSSEHILEAAAVALGVLLAWTLVDWPGFSVLILGILLVLHRLGMLARRREQTESDPKTGLMKETSWSEAAVVELLRARRAERDSGLLLLDLDHFAQVNDRHGDLVGDNILRAVAATLRAEVRAGDLIGRLDSEEFVVLLPGTGKFDALAIAERIRCRIAATTVSVATSGAPGISGTESRFVGATVSIGVSAHPRDGATLPLLLDAAGNALREAKAAGRNRAVAP
ncbi:diguanylate cyclase [Amycolatopsis sp.]|jgi:diguanylate cyclase (GGDEF)-like protein|uniref:GGDEF domain-containing protein n=1 Tax=Amycolatopsis sp. TaxID=37632 RepID=UPI002DFAA2F0|nr:diguanylate cyclase [Amycolatopsis sp.]